MHEATPLTGSPVGGVPHARRRCAPAAPRRLLALTALLAGATALAQPKGLPKIELERLTLNPAGTGSLLLGTGELLQKGGYRLSLTGHYENKPLQFRELVRTVDESGQPISSEEFRGSVVKHRVTGHLAGAYGLTRWLELSAQVPVLLSQRGDDLTQRNVGQPAEGLALGTPYLGLRLGLLSQRDGGDAVDLAVGLNAGLPLGGSESLARDNGLRAVPSVMVGRDFGPLRAAVDAGVLLRHRAAFPETTALDSEVGSGLRLGATLSTTGEGLRGELDVLGHLPFHEERASVEALAGARLPLSESLEAYALAGVGFGDAPGTASFRGLLGVAFGGGSPRCVAGGQHTPRQCPDLDDDHDGVLNRSDACPLEGGKVDATGCPEKDGDGDGVLDTADRCPTVPGAPERQGCPATDTDTDGVEDAQDQCPSVPGEAAHQGCPDTDRDGLRDSEDKCPTEAGPAERQGCPLRDSDQDGLLDEKDSCPTVAGIPEMKGCPPKDTDNDTVQDHVDNCPREAGPPSNQGCPVQQRQQVIIKKGRIELKDTVYFDTNKATIQPRSYALLDNVAKVLLEHPELEKVWIEGHTDSTGTPSENLKLSQRRAEAVRDYLINRGVGFQRLDARGFGQERPIADNKTVQGRAANRRVDFLTTPREGEQQ